MSLTKLLASIAGITILTGCISSAPIKNTPKNGELFFIKTYTNSNAIGIGSDTNRDGKWDSVKWGLITDIGEDYIMGDVFGEQQDTNQNGKFEDYEYIWPEGIGEKLKNSPRIKKEKPNSYPSDIYY